MEATPLQPPFQKLLTDFLDPVLPDPVALGIIQAAGDENIPVQALAKFLAADPGYRHYLFAQNFLSEKMTEWVGDTKEQFNREEILLSRILGLMGKVSVRNLIACARTARILGVPIATEGDDKISVTPSQVISFALQAESICEAKNWIFPEAAFCAGLYYDWLGALIKKRNGPPEEKAALESAFKEGIIAAKTAYQIGLGMKEIRLAKYLFGAALVLPIGKALMTCLYPKADAHKSWSKFVSDCDQAAHRKSDYYDFLEARRFPVTHLELSSLFVNFGGLLQGVEKCIYFSSNPERLSNSDLGLYQISSILSVVTRLGHGADDLTSFEPHHIKWMESNKIELEALKAAVAAAQK